MKIKKRIRRTKDERRQQILTCALMLAEHLNDYEKVTRLMVAESLGISEAAISKYFSPMSKLHRAIVGEAIKLENIPVLAQALARKHPRTASLPIEVKQQCFDFCVS